MKTLLALLCLVTSQSLYATSITLDLGPSNDRVIGDMAIPFSDLNGTALSGQSVALDFSFADSHFIRLLSFTSRSFDFLIKLNTNVTGSLLNCTGSGYVTDAKGNTISLVSSAGGSETSDHGETLNLFASIFPLFADANGSPRPGIPPLDFYGAHFALTLPDDLGADITGGQILLIPNGWNRFNDSFMIGPHIPETGQTWVLMALGIVVTLLYKWLQGNSQPAGK